MKLLGRGLTLEEVIGFVEQTKDTPGFTKCKTECLIFEAAVELAEAAKKQVEKKPEKYTDSRPQYDRDVEVDVFLCPECGNYLCDVDEAEEHGFDFCPNCGQAIKWGGGEDDEKTD